MINYSYCVPILPGGEALMRKWIDEQILDNPNHDRVFRQAGVTAEQVWIQRTPMGDFAVVTFGTEDPEKTFQTLSTSTDPWAIQFRNLLTKAHGVDFSKPMPLNEMVIDWCVFEKAM
jgi:hypothetical protein